LRSFDTTPSPPIAQAAWNSATPFSKMLAILHRIGIGDERGEPRLAFDQRWRPSPALGG
jgi:hypothetical protein